MNVSKTRLALAGIGLAAVVAATTAGTTALFTDSKTSANIITNGTIVLGTTPADGVLTVPSMMPGDQLTVPVTVAAGASSSQLRYSVTVAATDADVPAPLHLKDNLNLKVRSGVTTCDDTNYALTGTQLFSGHIDAS